MPFASPFIDIALLTGLGERQLPRALRAPEDTRCDLQTFISACSDDQTMNPGSCDLLVGSAGKFADFYDKSLRQMRRILDRPDAAFIHRLPGGLLATVVSSGAHHRDALIPSAISAKRRGAAITLWQVRRNAAER